jgi:uncharacterized protein (TIGR00304 family)
MASGRRTAGIVLVALGLGLLAYSAFRGDLRAGLFLIIPYLYGTGILPFLGFALLLVGGFLVLTGGVERVAAGPAWDYVPPERRGTDEPSTGGTTRARTKHGGFVMLGPIPIVWGNDKRMLPWLVALGLGLFLLMLFLPMLLR